MRDSTDGRVARGRRTRKAIVDAHAELLREGNLKPTAQVVAERAGVSVRTLWKNFADLEELLHESTQYWIAADDALTEQIDPGLPLIERVERFCAERTRRLENLAPAARSAALSEPFSASLRRSRAHHVRRLREEVERTFGPELDGRPADARTTDLHALATAASWPAWNLLRDDYGLGVDEATAVMRRHLLALLGC